MAQEHIFLNDIISDHRERMLNLKKYYPFFKLTDVSFSQFKEGKYEMLDMGYIVMAILRFFIEENNFKEKEVTYPEYLDFLSKCLWRDFGLRLAEEENKDIADYIFDKMKNDGRPFNFEYYDPVDRKKRISRMKIIESKIVDRTVWYSISADAIEFYLDTKEIKDESKISVQQLLLEKMIRSQDFKGGTEVVARINEEVSRLQLRKNEVLTILSTDVFAGIEAYESFVDTGMRWFEDEEKLFQKNKELIEAAHVKTADSGVAFNDIYELENQLKVAMNKHGELLRACMDMQKMTDDIVRKTKLSRLRSHFDFKNMLHAMIKNGDADVLSAIIQPLLQAKVKKSFNIIGIDDALTVRPEKYEKAEKVVREQAADIRFADELEDERIRINYQFIMNNLLSYMNLRDAFTLKEFNQTLEKAYSKDIFKNSDYYSFFVHLCQKKEYCVGGGNMTSESFLDDILFEDFNNVHYVRFSIAMADGDEEILEVNEGFEISNLQFTVLEKEDANNGIKES